MKTSKKISTRSTSKMPATKGEHERTVKTAQPPIKSIPSSSTNTESQINTSGFFENIDPNVSIDDLEHLSPPVVAITNNHITAQKTPGCFEENTKNISFSQMNDQEKDSLIRSLMKRVDFLVGTMCQLHSQLIISKHVSNELRRELDRQEQYSRRTCLLVSDKNGSENLRNMNNLSEILSETGVDKAAIEKEIDKFHPLGNENHIIVKFKSDSMKESIYFNKKQIKREEIRLSPSLTKMRQRLLSEAKTVAKENDKQIDYVFSDVHGNIKVKLKSKKRKAYHQFNSIQELYSILISNDDEYDAIINAEDDNESTDERKVK